MDINKLFKAGMNSCGRVLSVLPENEIGSPKKFMMEILEDETLPSLNVLFPRLFKTVLNVNKLIPLANEDHTGYIGYRVPLELTEGLKMMGIKAFYTGVDGYDTGRPVNGGYNGYLGTSLWLSDMPNKYGRYSSANLYETVMGSMLTYADLQLLGQIQEAPIPRFEAPNIIWINVAYASASTFFVTLLLENDKNLISLDENVFDAVRRLFILDIRKVIYNRFGVLSNIDTAIGNIDLKIDDWSGAEQERNELYEQYNSLSHLRKTTMIAG